MGQTLTTWIADVSETLRDTANASVDASTVERRGVRPALAQYAVDRPRIVVAEQTGSGTAYQPLPAGWASGFSRVIDVEYPARRNPPEYLDVAGWRIGRDPAAVTTERLIFRDGVAASSEYLRVSFTATWPTPTDDPTDDQVDAVGYNALVHLAAALVLTHLAAGSARVQPGRLATAGREGSDAADRLRSAADDMRAVYAAFLGLTLQGASPAVAGPAHGSIDFNPGYGSLFHGGRR